MLPPRQTTGTYLNLMNKKYHGIGCASHGTGSKMTIPCSALHRKSNVKDEDSSDVSSSHYFRVEFRLCSSPYAGTGAANFGRI